METKDILICDDHQILRNGLTRILCSADNKLLISEAATANEAFNLMNLNDYKMLILDLSLPDMDGLEVLRKVKTDWPKTKVLMLSMRSEAQYAIRCLQMGAAGYLNKEVASDELILAVKTIFSNQNYISESQVVLMTKHLDKTQSNYSHDNLSVREYEVFIKIADGKSIQEIATASFISVKTVSTYKARILKKLNIKTTSELARYCFEKNLI